MLASMSDPVGVVLAGGLGRRIGGDKATVALGGRPLLSYPIAAMRAALGSVRVVCKPATALPELPGATVWHEPESPSHPLVGIVEALRRADGAAVLVCAGDMPFVSAELLQTIAAARGRAVAAVAMGIDGTLEPLLARYERPALAPLAAALNGDGALPPARRVVAALAPRRVAVADRDRLLNVNTPADLERAERLLAATRR